MVLGPCWRDSHAEPLATGDATERARRIGERLVGELEQAQRWTNDWRDQALSSALVDVALSESLAELTALNLWGKANQTPSHRFWETAGPLLGTGELQHRARFKPRGYAGDYELMTRMCQGTVCDHPLGRHLDEFFLKQSAPQAVKARTEQTARSLVAHCMRSRAKPYRVVSVGCGPGLDITWAAETLPASRREDLEVVLFDMDQEALDAASKRLRPLLPEGRLHCVRENLFRLPKRKSAALLQSADFISCTGFFDYLTDEIAAQHLKTYWDALADGGAISLGNFAPQCSSRVYLEWFADWHLIYRTPEQMDQMAEAAGIPPSRREVGAERLGVDLFLSASKSAAPVPAPHFVSSRKTHPVLRVQNPKP
ncbi:MAG: class I SAM-dependent methyltransferase [Planctomycetales bacterium]